MKKLLLSCALLAGAVVSKAQAPSLKITDLSGLGVYAYFQGNVTPQPPCSPTNLTIGMTLLNPFPGATYTPASFSTWGSTTPGPSHFNGVHFNLPLSGGGYEPIPALTNLCGRATGDFINTSFMFSGTPLRIDFVSVSPTLIEIELR